MCDQIFRHEQSENGIRVDFALHPQAAIREHLIDHLGAVAEELDPPVRPSLGRGRLDNDWMGDEGDEEEEEDGQQVRNDSSPSCAAVRRRWRFLDCRFKLPALCRQSGRETHSFVLNSVTGSLFRKSARSFAPNYRLRVACATVFAGLFLV